MSPVQQTTIAKNLSPSGKLTKLIFMPAWVIIIAFIISACSTEEMDNLQVEKSLDEKTIDADGDFDLKKGNAQNQILAQIRKATAQYQNLDKAAADGYILDPHCVEHPQFGAMGQHAINMDRIVIPLYRSCYRFFSRLRCGYPIL